MSEFFMNTDPSFRETQEQTVWLFLAGYDDLDCWRVVQKVTSIKGRNLEKRCFIQHSRTELHKLSAGSDLPEMCDHNP